jgi:hypothetical protein
MWNRYVIAFSLSDQKEIVKAVSMPFMMPQVPDFKLQRFSKIFIGVLLIATAVVFFFLLKHIQLKRYGFVTGQYIKLQKALKRKGIVIKRSSTSSEVRNEALQLGTFQRILEFIKLYEEYRFGRREMGREGRERYQRLIKEITRELRT